MERLNLDRITFKVNGNVCSVGPEVSSTLTLVDYLRNSLELRGTKYMCREGGCGACVVTAVKYPGAQPMAVNACLVSVTSCQGWDITTVEKVGNKLEGYHAVQKKLAEYNGTQCGYCTPGWVMSMYSLLQTKKEMTMLEIEKSFGSNLCRCTGYRPILEAFKTFAKDAPKIPDIEDLSICSKTGNKCNKENKDCDEEEWCLLSKDEVDFPNNIFIKLKDGRYWFTVTTVVDIFRTLAIVGDDSYMLVSGNTAKGAYPIDEYPKVLIDVSSVLELKGYIIDQNLIIGAGNTLTELQDIFLTKSQSDENFSYLKQFYDHIQLVAHIPVRNMGSIAGNLMIKHQHNDFPSDIFLLLQTIGAQLTIVNRWGALQLVSMEQFLITNMRSQVILNAILPPINSSTTRVVTFKIMPKSQNAHAIVNAGFFYKLRNNSQIIQSRLVFGGLSPSFTRAHQTERFLIGKALFRNENLQGALNILGQELVVTEMPPEPSAEYRKKLALSLYYKGLLSIYPGTLPPLYKSGAVKLRESRPVSDARQIFDTNPALWPLNQPMPKIEALIQCSGEAEYTEDLPSFPREVFAAFVLSTVPNGKIENIDPRKALNTPGVLAFYTAKDIPGLNSFTPSDSILYTNNEEVLCSGEVKYYDQPIGIIVAESRVIAENAAKLVEVKYSGTRKPIIDLKEAKGDQKRLQPFKTDTATNRGTDIKMVVTGGNKIHEQYHMCMETLVCVTRPTEEGLEVHAATQWLDGTQIMISRALSTQENRVDVYVRRLGGAYGLKISRSIQCAVACSLVVQKLNRPCRFIQPLTTNMKAVGKRYPCLTEYEAGVSGSGEIQYINYKMYEGNGYTFNETLSVLAADSYYNCYSKERWNFNGYDVITDLPKNSWCRAPGTFEAISNAELIMEHISYTLSIDPIKVRLANLDNQNHSDIREMIETLKQTSNYDERRNAVDNFNKENRWKKRGLRTSFSRWTPFGGQFLDVNISVYHGDGTVVITHGGVDMGQGLNTLAVQICAYLLKIDIKKIQVKGNNTIIAPNCFITGGSLTTSNVGIGIQRCCEQLLSRLAPIRATLNDPTWEQLILAAYTAEVDLQAHGFVRVTDSQVYNIYGVAFAEVEVDILTGETEILRVDILQDVGRSINPEIDIGQVEGAFVMGQGYWTSEHLVYDSNSGKIQTDRTWNYYVPQARDIPQDFRVYFKKKSFSNEILFGSKATGEPPICLSVVVALAIREAITAARLDSGIPTTEWFPVDGPYTTEKVRMLTNTKIEDLKFY